MTQLDFLLFSPLLDASYCKLSQQFTALKRPPNDALTPYRILKHHGQSIPFN